MCPVVAPWASPRVKYRRIQRHRTSNDVGIGAATRVHRYRDRPILLQLHSSGVLTASCGAKLDHGVPAVAYGIDAGTRK